jgi:hypothetical protein
MNTLTDLLTTYAPLSYGLAFMLVLILLALAANLLLYISPSQRPLKSGQCGGTAIINVVMPAPGQTVRGGSGGTEAIQKPEETA